MRIEGQLHAMRGRVTTGILISAAFAMQGCAIAPGMTMDEPAELPEGKELNGEN